MRVRFSAIFWMLFCGKSFIFIPQTLKNSCFHKIGVASAPAILYDPYLMLLFCCGQSTRCLDPIEVLYWTMWSIREQFHSGPCAMCELRTLQWYLRPAHYICKGQKPEFPDWGMQSYSSNNTAKLSEAPGSLHQSLYSQHQQLQAWAPGCRHVLRCGV